MTSHTVSSNSDFILQARNNVAKDIPSAVITIVRGESVGAKILVTESGVQGSLGSPDLDQLAVTLARESIASESSGLVSLAPDVDVFVDVFPLPPLMVLIGAVHVAQAVVAYAEPLGFRIAVVDARQTLATPERFPSVDQLLVSWPEEAYARLPITSTSAIVILTHDPKFDEPAILGALKTDAGYIGAVGSRKTNVERRERLLESGATDDELNRVHGPIGLNIGGKSPEEMAISILAEIIAVRNGRTGGSLRAASGSIRGDGD